MTDKLQYNVTVEVDSSMNIDQFEQLLKSLLSDAYDYDGVTSIHVIKDGYTESNVGIDGVLDLIDLIDDDKVEKAIDTVKELENEDDDDE